MLESVELSRAECETLLRAGVAGRVALAAPDGPHIVPINYSVVDDTIVMRTSPYSLLGTYGRSAMLAFEVDQFDYEHQRGWSVVGRGRSEVVQDEEELEHIRAVWSPRPWASGVRRLVIRLPLHELTGRRLGDGWDPLKERPVFRVV
ncbi:MAG TPA: pyridoxamine 5'-phosphate oxidase family protein [Nocardioides sp.]|jgi:nitroimidazol reductase NimA-like FMN-containing flavoprotein (pyridoxamine 5'-phosphate oxidase superfamily)|nr:pyridoxamine 5'-phosphate oxidase family protein [Nocardioides sp.]